MPLGITVLGAAALVAKRSGLKGHHQRNTTTTGPAHNKAPQGLHKTHVVARSLPLSGSVGGTEDHNRLRGRSVASVRTPHRTRTCCAQRAKGRRDFRARARLDRQCQRLVLVQYKPLKARRARGKLALMSQRGGHAGRTSYHRYPRPSGRAGSGLHTRHPLLALAKLDCLVCSILSATTRIPLAPPLPLQKGGCATAKPSPLATEYSRCHSQRCFRWPTLTTQDKLRT